jgi:hypothetical protein
MPALHGLLRVETMEATQFLERFKKKETEMALPEILRDGGVVRV